MGRNLNLAWDMCTTVRSEPLVEMVVIAFITTIDFNNQRVESIVIKNRHTLSSIIARHFVMLSLFRIMAVSESFECRRTYEVYRGAKGCLKEWWVPRFWWDLKEGAGTKRYGSRKS